METTYIRINLKNIENTFRMDLVVTSNLLSELLENLKNLANDKNSPHFIYDSNQAHNAFGKESASLSDTLRKIQLCQRIDYFLQESKRAKYTIEDLFESLSNRNMWDEEVMQAIRVTFKEENK